VVNTGTKLQNHSWRRRRRRRKTKMTRYIKTTSSKGSMQNMGTRLVI
jgi:hypothetical protein